MKKKYIMSIIAITVGINSHAQTYDELFRQKKTQKEYLLQQVAAFKLYTGYIEKGYGIVTDGIRTVQSIKKGDFGLHANYFGSFGHVNPNIKQYSKVATIILLHVTIVKQVSATIKQCGGAKQLTNMELQYMGQTFDRLLDDCTKDLEELSALLANNGMQMKDDERLKAIDKIYAGAIDKQAFVQSFGNRAKGLSLQKWIDKNDIISSKRINDLQ